MPYQLHWPPVPVTELLDDALLEATELEDDELVLLAIELNEELMMELAEETGLEDDWLEMLADDRLDELTALHTLPVTTGTCALPAPLVP